MQSLWHIWYFEDFLGIVEITYIFNCDYEEFAPLGYENKSYCISQK